MEFNQIVARAKAILLSPKTEWPVIANEPATVADLYTKYIIFLAAIPAIFTFIKYSLIGFSVPFAGTMRIGIGAGLSSAIVTYVLSLGAIYLIALIIDVLAPSFDGQKNQVQALKTAAYAYTAYWVASVAIILPWLGALIVIAGGIYSIYLLNLGLPHTMKNPEAKSVGYTAVTIITAIVVNIVIFSIVGGITGGAMMAGASYGVSNNDSDVSFDKDSPLGKMEQWTKNMEAATKKMEDAGKSGDSDAQADAMKTMMGAALGGGDEKVESLAPDRLKPFLPSTLADLPQVNMSAERGSAMGLQISTAEAEYSDSAGQSVRLEITDTGNAKGLLSFASSWAGIEGERQTSNGYEKTYKENGRMIHEEWSGDRGEYAVVVAERFTVKVSGTAKDIDVLKDAMDYIDLDDLEDLKGEGIARN